MATAVPVSFFPRRILQCSAASGFAALLLMTWMLATLTGCASGGGQSTMASGGGQSVLASDDEEPITADDLFDMKLQHIETSPVPGATARVLPDPPGATRTGPMVGACVTDAGYCPLAAETEAGRNCLCQTAGFVYGGLTNIPPKYNSTTNPW